MIKAVLFDLDDTLLWDEKSVKMAFELTCKVASDKFGINPDTFERKVRENARRLYATYEVYPFTQMIGINPFEGLWGEFDDEREEFRQLKEIAPAYREQAWTLGLQDVGIDNPEFGLELSEFFRTARKESPFLYDDSLSVLELLKGEYKLLLITNGSPSLQNLKLGITPELAPYFDEIIISGDFGRGKPDQTIFEHALATLSVDKSEAIMVGDNVNTDILGANRAGIPSVWLNRHGREKGEVKPTYEISSLTELLSILENK
ncbi:HAD family hydrolase [Oceanobacillus chungangensis]|uniref:Phosphoserine phosphatase n=1 Tax=Oceanobacillus chungangensis TaxID=1229152 RepID=A0A3D8PK44_9BACI|nr:HAD family hydrolase [Oceanobacillus chungangensis]RDW15565.1 haloacid dehalogenase [Oceanobacillus chungangensis]